MLESIATVISLAYLGLSEIGYNLNYSLDHSEPLGSRSMNHAPQRWVRVPHIVG